MQNDRHDVDGSMFCNYDVKVMIRRATRLLVMMMMMRRLMITIMAMLVIMKMIKSGRRITTMIMTIV